MILLIKRYLRKISASSRRRSIFYFEARLKIRESQLSSSLAVLPSSLAETYKVNKNTRLLIYKDILYRVAFRNIRTEP